MSTVSLYIEQPSYIIILIFAGIHHQWRPDLQLPDVPLLLQQPGQGAISDHQRRRRYRCPRGRHWFVSSL